MVMVSPEEIMVQGKPVALFTTEWSANYFIETNPKVPVSALPPEQWKQAA